MLNPTPLSRTKTTTSSELPRWHPTVIWACSRVRVYLMALERKLAKTCFRRFQSPSTTGQRLDAPLNGPVLDFKRKLLPDLGHQAVEVHRGLLQFGAAQLGEIQQALNQRSHPPRLHQRWFPDIVPTFSSSDPLTRFWSNWTNPEIFRSGALKS